MQQDESAPPSITAPKVRIKAVAPESEPFDPKVYAKLSPKEKGAYMASLFVQTMNANAEAGTITP